MSQIVQTTLEEVLEVLQARARAEGRMVRSSFARRLRECVICSKCNDLVAPTAHATYTSPENWNGSIKAIHPDCGADEDGLHGLTKEECADQLVKHHGQKIFLRVFQRTMSRRAKKLAYKQNRQKISRRLKGNRSSRDSNTRRCTPPPRH